MNYQKLKHMCTLPEIIKKVNALQSMIGKNEKIYLNYVCTFKNTYAGKSNIQFRYASYQTGITESEWNEAKNKLIKIGVLNAAGAKTDIAWCLRQSYNFSSAGNGEYCFKSDINNY